jgi:hypothetical protein
LFVKNFQKLANRFLRVACAPLNVFGEQHLCIAHGSDHQFFIGNADESGNIHVRFPPRWRLATLSRPVFKRGKVDWFHPPWAPKTRKCRKRKEFLSVWPAAC